MDFQTMDFDDAPSSAEEESEVTPNGNTAKPRSLKSLTRIAVRFVELLHKTEAGRIDLKDAVRILAFPQKRRIYDITNVLEGIGLIEKISKNVVQWKGVLHGNEKASRKHMLLKCELQELTEKEEMLDLQMRWVRQSIKNIYEESSSFSYVNQEDICNSFTGHTLLAVQAPLGTQLDVPIPKAIRDGPTMYQVHLKSISGPINVMLLNKRSASAEAIGLPVPPSKDILHRARLALGNLTEKQIRTLCFQATENTSPKNVRTLQTLFREMESNNTGMSGFHCLSKNIRDLLDPSKEIHSEIKPAKANDLFKLTSEVIPPLSPPPLDDYHWDLNESESLCDLFDIPMLNV